jgi:hypothetical protein
MPGESSSAGRHVRLPTTRRTRIPSCCFQPLPIPTRPMRRGPVRAERRRPWLPHLRDAGSIRAARTQCRFAPNALHRRSPLGQRTAAIAGFTTLPRRVLPHQAGQSHEKADNAATAATGPSGCRQVTARRLISKVKSLTSEAPFYRTANDPRFVKDLWYFESSARSRPSPWSH